MEKFDEHWEEKHTDFAEILKQPKIINLEGKGKK